MTDDIKRLRELAERATSGPWKHDIDKMWADGADVTIYSGDNYVVNVSAYPPGSERSVAFDASHANAAYIAAASPDVLLRLLDERDALREAAREAEREACARVCEGTTAAWTQLDYNAACMDCATAIRNRAEGQR